MIHDHDLDHQLARQVRAWRGEHSQRDAAAVLGMSLRTYQGIEQGRGFNYSALLLQFVNTVTLEGSSHESA